MASIRNRVACLVLCTLWLVAFGYRSIITGELTRQTSFVLRAVADLSVEGGLRVHRFHLDRGRSSGHPDVILNSRRATSTSGTSSTFKDRSAVSTNLGHINLNRFACLFAVLIFLTFGSPLRAQTLPQPMTSGGEAIVDETIFPPLTSLESVFDGLQSARESCFADKPGANAHERSMWGTITSHVYDPHDYPHITSLDNDDPSSFWYTFRPNIFNIQVPDEWDYFNLINTDRSDFTDTPVSVGKGVTYLETGVTYSRTLTSDTHTELRTLPETLLRYGITDEFELRLKSLGYSMIDQKDLQSGQSGSTFGVNDLDAGFKMELLQQKNWVPLTTFVGGVLLPSGTNCISGNSVQPHFNIVNGWGIRRYIFLKHQFGLDYLTQPNFSVAAPGTSTGPYGLVGNRPTVDSFHSSVSCLYQAFKHLGGFVEWYAQYGHNQATTNFLDTGLFLYLTPNVQLDCVIGSSVGSPDSTLFTKAGFSTRW